jgi:hypothetical protein
MIAETAGVVLSFVEKKAVHLPYMMQDCIKTIGNITTVNATTFFQTIQVLTPEPKYR